MSGAKRIVSFLPSATETLYGLGLGRQIVGVTHECKFPAEAKKKPQVIRPSFDPRKMTSAEIDKKIVEMVHSGMDIYIVDDKALRKAKPDLIVAQGLCEVCSPFTKEINRAVSILDDRPDILVLDPHDLEDVLIGIMDVAERVDSVKEGRKMVALLQRRIDFVRNRTLDIKPKVLCIEWIDPLFSAGHWVPQMVEFAGGINGISSTGEQSRRMTMSEVAEFDPDIIVLMPCGYDIKRTLREIGPLKNKQDWKSLRAVREGKVYLVDAGAYFSKPGPRTIAGLEILAKIIQPQNFKKLKVPRNSLKKL